MRRLFFATTNAGKLRELSRLVEGLPLQVVGRDAFGTLPEVEETGTTFAENARLKAMAMAEATGLWCLADDSGLAVDALDGAPGVQSARYVEGSDRDRYEALLRALQEVSDDRRQARFHCALCLAGPEGVLLEAEGRCEGRILRAPVGEGGFGYDPIFGVGQDGPSMATLTPAEKQAASHRGAAFRELGRGLVDLLGSEDRDGGKQPGGREG